jgi:hypothetical protein
VIDYLASAANPWPNTALKLQLVCEVRPADKDGRVTYGVNEFVIDGKICRYVLKRPEAKRD